MNKIIPYKSGSQSAKALARALGIKVLRREGNRIVVRGNLINWGCSVIPERVVLGKGSTILNPPDNVRKAANKLQAFKILDGNVPIPGFTESPHEACKWLYEDKQDVVVRLKLNGHSGDGILIETHNDPARIKNPDLGIPGAPLYTKYIKKSDEYRVHVFKDNAFFVQKKARKLDVPDEDVNWQVRNHQNGFIYANKDVEVSDEIKLSCINAVRVLGLDFGAVDVITNKKGNHFILEINTACGLEGTTLEKYCEQFKNYL